VRTTTLNFYVNPSYAISAWILSCAAFALIVTYNLTINPWAKGSLILCISSYTVYLYLREACRLLPTSWIKVHQLTATEWLLANRRFQPCAGKLRADTFVSSWLVILRFDRIGTLAHVPKVMSVPLLFCDLKPEVWRELNIYLRWQAQKGLNKE
jgi:hypothetical protein